MNEPLVLYEVENRIATLTLNRPEKRNALNAELVSDLTSVLEAAAADEQVKVIVLKARGSVFSAGADLAYLKELQQNSFEENIADSKILMKLYTTILFLPKVVIAQVEGHAIAGGCGLATVCDFVFAVPEAQFGYTEVKLGFVPALVSCLLIRKTSETIVKRILLTGEIFTAETALQYNLITFVTSADEINQSVAGFALDLCSNCSAESLKVTKELINKTTFRDIENMLAEAAEINAKARSGDDFKKGVNSFLNKQKTNW